MVLLSITVVSLTFFATNGTNEHESLVRIRVLSIVEGLVATFSQFRNSIRHESLVSE